MWFLTFFSIFSHFLCVFRAFCDQAEIKQASNHPIEIPNMEIFFGVYLKFAWLKTSKNSTSRIFSRNTLTTRHHLHFLDALTPCQNDFKGILGSKTNKKVTFSSLVDRANSWRDVWHPKKKVRKHAPQMRKITRNDAHPQLWRIILSFDAGHTHMEIFFWGVFKVCLIEKRLKIPHLAYFHAKNLTTRRYFCTVWVALTSFQVIL